MGTFDPSSFLDESVNESNSTVSTPVPEGEYQAVAGEPAIRSGTDKNGDPWTALDITWSIDGGQYPAVAEATGRPSNSVRQSFFLDVDANGKLDIGKGKNVSLGRLREALGLNTPGKPFSFRMIQGQVAKVTVKHRVYQDALFADVKAVARAG